MKTMSSSRLSPAGTGCEKGCCGLIGSRPLARTSSMADSNGVTRFAIARLTTRSLNVTSSVSGVDRFRSMFSTVNCPLMLFGPTTTSRGSEGGGGRRGEGRVTTAFAPGTTVGVERDEGRSSPSACPGRCDTKISIVITAQMAATWRASHRYLCSMLPIGLILRFCAASRAAIPAGTPSSRSH